MIGFAPPLDRMGNVMPRLRTLVIEDNLDLAANLVDFPQARGYEVESAADGITGLHLAIVNDYDVVVLDLLLPGMDGLTVCRKLCEDAGKSAPLLMLTARDSLEDKINGLDAGADDYVVKPFAVREVEALLRGTAPAPAGRPGCRSTTWCLIPAA